MLFHSRFKWLRLSCRSPCTLMGNLKNIIIAVSAPFPSVAFYACFLRNVQHSPASCRFFKWSSLHPFLLANLLFFINIDLLFWSIGLLQSSHWLIDLYWTVVPVMLVHFYASHPYARFNIVRSVTVILLTWSWSIRLTHNYLRRESWQLGIREDWRFSVMRERYGKHWWWLSFIAVYVVQQVFLIGVCLPMYVIHASEKPCNIWDLIAALVCTNGIVVAYLADTQLFTYVQNNSTLKKNGAAQVPVLDKGLWRYSRHPNYFGEQLWWWGLVIFGWNVGHRWAFVGALVNSLCLYYVTGLVELRMLSREDRAEAYKNYQKATSVWIPWFKCSTTNAKDKKC